MQNIISNKKFFLCLFIIFSIFWASDIKAETYIDARWVGGTPSSPPSCTSPFQNIDESNCVAIQGAKPQKASSDPSKLNPYVCCGSNTNVSGTSSGTDILKTPPLEKIKTVFTPQAPIPGIDYGSLEGFLSSIYKVGIGFVGILALVQLIRGGVMYMISGAVDQKGAAKLIITDAFIGLALALGSYLIIYTINPNLLKVSLPKAPPKTNISGGLPSTASSTPSTSPIPEGAKEGLISKCMGYPELQSHIDNGYGCIDVPEEKGTCTTAGEGYFRCYPSATSATSP